MGTMYRGGRIHSTAVRNASAMLVDGPTVVWIGDDATAASMDADRVVDLDGAWVAPAFVDAHVHLTEAGLRHTGPDIAAATSLAQLLGILEDAARRGRGRPIVATGWDERHWPERRPPTRAELDRAGFGGAICLIGADGGRCVVSSAFAAAVTDPPVAVGYSRDAPLTGPALDGARAAALGMLPAATRRAAQLAALRDAAAHGIACVQQMAEPARGGGADLLELRRLTAAQPLPEVIAYWGEPGATGTARDLGAVGVGCCDVSFAAPVATASIVAHLLGCARAGLQAVLPGGDDAAVDQVLDALAEAGRRLGHDAGAGNRIDGVTAVVDPARLAASGLVAVLRPGVDAGRDDRGGPATGPAGDDRGGSVVGRAGGGRAAAPQLLADLAAAGVPLAFGSVAQAAISVPWETIRAAVHSGNPGNLGRALSLDAAFGAHTRGGWRAAGRGGGTLAPGAAATFAVWDLDDAAAPSHADPHAAAGSVPDVSSGTVFPRCRYTLRDGVVIFEA